MIIARYLRSNLVQSKFSLKMEKWLGKTAVVTGAGSGNGAAITTALLREGINVVALELHDDRLGAIIMENLDAPGKLSVHQCDVTKPESVHSVFTWIEKHFDGVDILVNNAGVFNNGQLLDTSKPTEYYLATINTNISGYVIVARRAFMSMKNKPFGYIININSTVGHTTACNEFINFGINIYGATKHAVTELSAVLKLEICDMEKNIRVTSISPGPVATNFDLAGNFPRPEGGRFWDMTAHLEASDIADQVIYLLGTKPSVNISELTIEPMGKTTLSK